MSASPYERIGRPRHPDVLTPAEWEVLAGVREGRNNREIAEARGCGLETVRFHLRNLREKLAVRSRDELRAFPGRPAAAIEGARTASHRIREQIPLLHVRDMMRALRFYEGLLGFETVSRWPDQGGVPGWVALAAGGARLMLRVGHPKRRVEHPRAPGPVTISLYVDGLDELRAKLAAAEHSCAGPDTLFYGAREFYVRDPDGNEIAIVEFAASDPGYMASAGDGDV